ncbi:conserved hypothetical protein [Roseibium sp. TrichSKD4]|uniref:DUF2259 domain-containing protein n=1 Tax=Roseibium sp. TrichSKD4 TaxID=744980 RepID=UPI0001E56ACC|nr:DUF2259 domain-containing protein [Roseibium sp. TrichSKD4]EFO30669.1 conserved hypothetical protein [Roseibium sp. TrichSKD4]
MRRLLLAFSAFFLVPLASFAGDQASLQILGFSKDGNHFAFEQYGIQDGSGFPYSEIYVLDVKGDKWVKPSPFRRTDEVDETQGYDPDRLLTETRSENRLAAQELLSGSGIAGKGEIVGHNPITELNANPFEMRVNPRFAIPAINGELTVSLSQFDLPDETCSGYGAETKGFRLSVSHAGQTRTLHHDKILPKSRGCALSYRIDRVVTYFPQDRLPVMAIFVHVSTLGFEGPDGRFIAITAPF